MKDRFTSFVSDPNRSRLRRRWGLLFAGLFLFSTYLLTAPGNRSEADDAFWFACQVRQGGLRQELLGSFSHLLFLPVMDGGYRLLRQTGANVSSYDFLRSISSLAAAIAAVTFFSFARLKLHMSSAAAFASTAGLCVSYGFWRYANEAEVYSLAAALTVFGLWQAFSADSRLRAVATGLVFALATLIHILTLIPALVVAPFVIARRGRIRELALYSASFLATLFGLTVSAYVYVDQGSLGFRDFVETPSGSLASWLADSAQSVVGLGQSLVAGNFLFANDRFLDLMERQFPSKVLDEERFLGAQTGSTLSTVALLTFALLIVLVIAFLLVRWRHRATSQTRDRTLVLFLCVWIVSYWLVVARVDPGAPEAWIPLLTPFWLLIGLTLFSHSQTGWQWRLMWLVLAALMIHNLVGGMLIMRDASTDYNARKAAWLVTNTHTDDVILTAEGSVYTRYLAYQAPALVIGLRGLSPEAVRTAYLTALTASGDVYVTGDIVRSRAAIHENDPELSSAIDRLSAEIEDRIQRVRSDSFGEVFRLIRVGSRPTVSGLPAISECR